MDARHARKTARESLRAFVIVGAILGVVGGLIMGLTWPHEDAGLIVEQKGSAVGLAIGALIAWAGNVLLFVGLIGWGVALGREASPAREETVR